MNNILHDFLDDFVLCYLDDILIYSRSEEEHLVHLEKVLIRLRANSIYLGIEKCEFFKDRVEYVGHIVSSSGIEMDPKKVSAIRSWHALRSVTEIRSFLGLLNYYRRFIPRLSAISRPLIQLTKKNVPFIWTSACQTAFTELKRLATSAPVMKPPDFTRPFVLHTDACGTALGSCLMQRYDDGLHPIAYHSRTFSLAERGYDVRDKENLAIVDSFRTWRHLLLGSRTLVHTDHHSL
eukprot:Nk52_evm1s34 gene=Nk52_evmTU1s34